MKPFCRIVILVMIGSNLLGFVSQAGAADLMPLVHQAVAQRQVGKIGLSIQMLMAAQGMADTDEARTMVSAELGRSFYQARNYEKARAYLREAFDSASGLSRGQLAIDLGNVAVAMKQMDDATRYYNEALKPGAGSLMTQLSAKLNMARFAPAQKRMVLLQSIENEIEEHDEEGWATIRLNLGAQAQLLGEPAHALAYRNLVMARDGALAKGDNAVALESMDALAQLYETRQRFEEAIILDQQALELAQTLPISLVTPVMIQLEWRQGRLQKASGNIPSALAAYQRASELI